MTCRPETERPIMIISTFGPPVPRQSAGCSGSLARTGPHHDHFRDRRHGSCAASPDQGVSGRMCSVAWDDLAEVGRGRT